MSAEPTYEIVDITPELAADWLDRYNTHNRNLRRRVVAAYARDMEANNWQQTGESIKRAVDGTILDGQHRLAAIAEANVTVRMLVVGNLPMRAQEAVDGGPKRSFSDTLRLRGEKQYVLLASLVRRAWFWNSGLRKSTGNYSPSIPELLVVLEQHPELRHSTEVVARIKNSVPIPGSILGLCHWLTYRIDPDDAEFFFARLADGVNLEAGHPVYVLRKAAIEGHTSKSRLTEVVAAAYVIKAWNAYRDGRTMGLLRYRPGGANPETFPEPR
ncbi:hypothetical protein I0C86_41570 [Plantactinospora sp. S1510]|uniref:ParB/Sulfiredoxin domain-containing protein n=1 Tax=Plantactinospora alkalitolerans TaxID=2789879 RepID=A0ABS0HA45_9ACTN|nr:hypothetical protein [Plantactinospora alkalitolerans]MBF9135343.1 hypothetical protein [Plantactinospora alkalitolerans]